MIFWGENMKRLLALLISAFFALSFCACTKKEENKPIEQIIPDLTVNGERVIEEEYKYFYEITRSEIITDYAQKYEITDFYGFWEKEFDGKTPTAELEERTIRKCVRAKIELNLCKDNGIYDDISFDGLKAKAEQFNAENKNKSGVVGLKSISMNTFYTYYIDTGVMELKNRLEKDELKPDKNEIKLQIDSMTDDMKSDLSEEEIYNFAVDKAVNEKYDKFIEQKISEALVARK